MMELASRRGPLLPPKDVNHGPPRTFPCVKAVSGDHAMVGEGHAPVGAVLLAQAEADESIPDTKGRESWTPQAFSLQIGSFLGTATVAMMAIADTPRPRAGGAAD
jgi:hypothetical protein